MAAEQIATLSIDKRVMQQLQDLSQSVSELRNEPIETRKGDRQATRKDQLRCPINQLESTTHRM